MGLRGKLPSNIRIEPEMLDDLDPPEWLDEIGRQHWADHSQWLADNGLLTSATKDSFAVCCSLYSKYVGDPNHKGFNTTVQRYQSLAKIFRLLPTEFVGKPVSARHQVLPTFEEMEGSV